MFKHHVFIAYSGQDLALARRLSELLAPRFKTFVAKDSLLPGEEWDLEIPKAQREAFVTVVLVTKNTETSFFQQEEIKSAIELSRSEESIHQVVPLLVGISRESIPYGLRRLHSITIEDEEELQSSIALIGRLLVKINREIARYNSEVSNDLSGSNMGGRTEEVRRSADESSIWHLPYDRAGVTSVIEAVLEESSKASILYLDIDTFSQLDKTYGPIVANIVIKTVEEIFAQMTMKDYGFRWGEDEFLACLNGYNESQALQLADRICRRIRSFNWDAVEPGLRVTGSLGVAEKMGDQSPGYWIVRAILGCRVAKASLGDQAALGPLEVPANYSEDPEDYFSP